MNEAVTSGTDNAAESAEPAHHDGELERRLRVLEDIDAIAKLKAAYCAACDDDHNGEAVAALFVEDGTWERAGQPPCHGRDAIAAYMNRIHHSRVMNRSAHMVTNPVIEVDGDEATGRWRFVMMYTASDDRSFVRIIGHYRETYVRRDGRWFFQSLQSNVEEQGTYVAAPTQPADRSPNLEAS